MQISAGLVCNTCNIPQIGLDMQMHAYMHSELCVCMHVVPIRTKGNTCWRESTFLLRQYTWPRVLSLLAHGYLSTK